PFRGSPERLRGTGLGSRFFVTALTEGVSRSYVSAIRAAREWGKRPTAIITQDDWYGHRDPLTGHPQGDRDEWVTWDHALANAYQTIEDYSDEYGLLPWTLDDEYIDVYANKKIHKFKAAVDNATKGTEKKPY